MCRYTIYYLYTIFRSDDGGDTWSILNYTVPFLTDADGFPIVTNGAENYQVAAYENHVYVLFGMINSDLVLIHSDDYGADGSWESMPIVDFPMIIIRALCKQIPISME
ncbi:MAG: hypothetical protein IPL12_14935 [Bacteroidetes bacterium]|nr:hypothetical protein [Bacteroidota bacterium]